MGVRQAAVPLCVAVLIVYRGTVQWFWTDQSCPEDARHGAGKRLFGARAGRDDYVEAVDGPSQRHIECAKGLRHLALLALGEHRIHARRK